jgi:hypothetical protein
MSNLSVIDTAPVEIERAIQVAKAQAIDQFAAATVEEIMLAAAQRRLQVLEGRRRLVMATFNVTDVAKLGDKLAKNKYAAEKLHEIFGGTFEFLKDNNGRPLSDMQVVENDPDVGTYRIYTYYGRYERPDGKVTEQMGSFSTKDAFFARAHEEWKTMDQVNVVDVMVAAQTETYKKCIFRGTGLGDWTDQEATELITGAKGHDFKGSQAGAGVKPATIGFGKSKSKDVTELGDADLVWYAKAYEENVGNPERAKYKKDNQRMLDAIRAEQKRRAGGPAEEKTDQQAETGTAAPPSGTRGESLTALHARLKEAFGAGKLKHVIPFLSSTFSRKVEALSDLTEEEVAAVMGLQLPDLKKQAEDFVAAAPQ